MKYEETFYQSVFNLLRSFKVSHCTFPCMLRQRRVAAKELWEQPDSQNGSYKWIIFSDVMCGVQYF